MALQYEVEDVSELDEAVQTLYEQDEESGKYRLKVEGLDDGAELKTALQKEREEHKAKKAKLKELEDQRKEMEEAARKAQEEAARKNGDVEALEKSWEEKLNALAQEKDAKLSEYEKMVSGLTVGQTAAMLAAEVFGEHAELMRHHVESRLTYEMTEEGPKTRVLKDGKPSALSVEDLKKEFQGDKRFAPFIIGTKASGPGGHGGPDKPDAKTVTRSEFDKMDPARKSAFMRKGGQLVEG